jgi:hypothetical protein
MARLTYALGPVTLAAECADFLKPQAESLLNHLAGLSGLAEGLAVRFGWSRLVLRQRGDVLLVCEPDYAGDPFAADSGDLTRTLGVIAQQCELVAQHGAEPLDARFDDMVIAAKGCLDQPNVVLERAAPVPGDSGWYVGPTEGPGPGDEAANFEAVFVYELWKRRRALLPALAFPPGWSVAFAGEQIQSVTGPAKAVTRPS